MKTRFFSNVSHEFRTPLTLIIGPLEDILSKEDLTEKNRVTMERMHRNAVRLLGLINQLLDLSKLDAGSMKLVMNESCDAIQPFDQLKLPAPGRAEAYPVSHGYSG